MAQIARYRLLFPAVTGCAGQISRLSSSATSSISSAAGGIAASSAGEPAGAGDQPTAGGSPASSRKGRGFLKFAAFASIAAAIGGASFVTCAYSLEEVDRKTKDFRKSAMASARDDLSGFEKFQNFVYTTAMNVPVKVIEFYLDTRSQIEDQIRGFTEPSSDKLLPDLHPQEQHVFTLVLDLNETLVYSDWQRDRGWRTFKRPGVDAFLEHLAKFYEIVVYSDQLNMYVDPVVDRLDPKGYIRYRLSRPATKYVDGKHYRDLSKLNRDPSRILYLSGHAVESSLQPENCVPVKPYKLENNDTALLDLIPFLEYVAIHRPADIRAVIASYQGQDIASEFIKRSKEHERRLQGKQQGGFWRR